MNLFIYLNNLQVRILNIFNKAFQLAGNGYDVWIGNARGTEFSKNHQTLDSNSTKFWDFSFHEIAIYDLPAMIDKILTETNQQHLHYIGNSQGATIIIALLSFKPEYNKKILTLHLMTPVVFLRNTLPWLKGSVGSLVDVVMVSKQRSIKIDFVVFIQLFKGNIRCYGHF